MNAPEPLLAWLRTGTAAAGRRDFPTGAVLPGGRHPVLGNTGLGVPAMTPLVATGSGTFPANAGSRHELGQRFCPHAEPRS